MAATKRRQILEAVRARLQAIKIASDYHTDAGDVVFLGETPVLGPDDPHPVALAMIVLTDDPVHQQQNVKVTLPIEVQIVTQPNAAEQARPWLLVEDAIGDVKVAVEAGDRTLGGLLASGLDLKRGPVRFLERTSGNDIVGAGVEYRFGYVEGWGTP